MPKTIQRISVCILSMLMMVFLIVSLQPTQSWAASFPENEGLSQEQIDQRFQTINSTYEVGEAFNESDADFVLKYGSYPTDILQRDSKYFHTSGSGSGTTIEASGTLYHNGTFNYTYGGNVTISKSAGATPRNLKLTVHCTSYGPVGSGGVGIIYNDGVSASKSNSAYFAANPSRTYSGVMTVFYLDAWVDVTTSTGNMFTVRG